MTSKKQNKDCKIEARVTKEQKAAFTKAAKSLGMSLSKWLIKIAERNSQ